MAKGKLQRANGKGQIGARRDFIVKHSFGAGIAVLMLMEGNGADGFVWVRTRNGRREFRDE
jgi:hypothetical protein